MVTRSLPRLAFIVFLTFALFLSVFNYSAKADTITYRVDQEYVKIWINQDGSIDLLYNITITCLSGTIRGFYVGQPNGHFKIVETKDSSGVNLNAVDASGNGDYRADVTLVKPISSGESAGFALITNVAGMVFKDEDNPGNYGMKFIASWFEDAEVLDLRVMIVFPPGAESDKVKNIPDWSALPQHDPDEDGRLTMYWERHNIGRGQKFEVGVSFPSSLMPNYKVEDKASNILVILIPLIFIVVVAIIIILFIVRSVASFGRKTYLAPQMGMEALGIRAGLTAVEAAQLLGLPPQKVVTAILYGLLLKKAVSVEGVEPNLKLKASPNPQGLRYYEMDFLNAIKPDGYLSEEKLAGTIMYLRDTVDNKLRGYCREDTMNHYKGVVEQAWKQVESAQAPELASNLFNDQLLWLMLDGRYIDRTREKFTPIIFIPSPDWGWYHYNKRYSPTPESSPTPSKAPTTPAGKPSIPGADFANSVAKSLEQTSSRMVSNMEKFTSSILPPPAQKAQSNVPVQHKSNCVCACHACACACACVSCACACASGGAH